MTHEVAQREMPAAGRAGGTSVSSADREILSREEVRLAKLLCQGVTRETIAQSLDIDPAEVVTRVCQLIKRVGAKGRIDLLAKLDKLGRHDG